MLKVREVEDADLIPLSEFLPHGFPYTTKEFWLHQFEWWWISNPTYTDLFPRGWVLEKDGSIHGFIGNIPVKFLVNGKVIITAASNSWYVDPSARGIFSFILFNKYVEQKSAPLLLFKGEDNEHIMNILAKYSFQEIILPLSQKEYVYIINKKKINFVFLKFIFTRKLPKIADLPEMCKRVGHLIRVYIYQKPLIIVGSPSDNAYSSSICTSCDDSFSRLWEPYLNSHDTFLSRDTKTLNWLYFSSARSAKRIVIQCQRLRDKTLAGYMVFDLIPMKMSKVNNMSLIDMCMENNDPLVLESLISFAIEMGNQHNAALLILWGNSPETEAFFDKTITLRRTVKHYRFFKLSNRDEMDSGRDNHKNVFLPMIYPPQ